MNQKAVSNALIPSVDMNASPRAVPLADGVSIVYYTANPDNIIMANAGALCLTPTTIYFKTENGTKTGWKVVFTYP